MDNTHRFIEKDDKGLKNTVGIYAIVNKVNNHLYIGQSKDILERKKGHFSKLKKNRHENTYLQNAFNFHGSNNFSFVVIEFTKMADLNDREQFWICKLAPEYNIALNIYGPLLLENKKQEPVKEIRIDKTFIRPEWHQLVYGKGKEY